jgi:protein phosphatase
MPRGKQETAEINTVRSKPWNDSPEDRGPFDIIGDIHGCYDELIELLTKLGYDLTEPSRVAAPFSRKVVFLGDLVDRGPKVVEVLALVRSMCQQGIALCIPGNHDMKLLRKLRGKDVQITRMEAQARQAATTAASTPPKKVVVDDNEPAAKKPVKKKKAAAPPPQ